MSEIKEKLPKEKKEVKEQKKRGQLMTVFTKEYKHEGLILLTLAVIAIVLGVLIITATLTIPSDVFLLGDYPLVFAWILVGLGVLSLLLAIWPYYKPSIEELKRVTWITRGDLVKDSLTVFLFVLIFIGFFALADSGFAALVKWFKEVRPF